MPGVNMAPTGMTQLFLLRLSGNKTLSNREVGATHGMCAYTRGRLRRYAGLMSAALPRMNDLWPRLRRMC